MPGVLLLAPFYAHAQSTCGPSNIGYSPYVTPSAIATAQPFTVGVELCPVPQPAKNVQLVLTNQSGAVVQSGAAITDANGLATIPVTGLPSGSYTVTETFNNAPGSGTIYPPQFYPPTYSLQVGGGRDASALNGQFAILMQGITSLPTDGTANQVAAIGSITADGNGNIVSGEIDLNSASASYQQIPVQGYYTLNGTQGALILYSFLGKQTINFSVSDALGSPTSPVQIGRLTVQQPSAIAGTGILRRQDSTSFPIEQVFYSLRMTGETACNASCAASGGRALPVGGTGSYTEFGGTIKAPGDTIVDFGLDLIVGLTEQPGGGEQGSFSVPSDNNGRSVLTLTPGGQTNPVLPSKFAKYQVDATHMFLMSLDAHSTAELLSGEASQ